jgi:uncharacterized protein YjbI with pentapeptide repeats
VLSNIPWLQRPMRASTRSACGNLMKALWMWILVLLASLPGRVAMTMYQSRAEGDFLMKNSQTFALAVLAIALTDCAAAAADEVAMSRDQVITQLKAQGAKPDLSARNLANLDLTQVDFKGANLSAAVLNGATLSHARLDGCNLTVSFFEGADLSNASLRKATLFSTQMAGAKLRNADLSGARLIADLHKADLSGATVTHVDGAADMKNQSMGLMQTRFVSGTAIDADFSDSDFSRSDFSFADLTGARLIRTKLVRTDLSGAVLKGANLSGADLHDAQLVNADLQDANLTDADLTGSNMQGVHGLDTAIKTGARGLP